MLRGRVLYALRDDGQILELSRGLYQLVGSAGVANVDFVAVCARASQGMIAMASAQSCWDLTDDIPAAVHVAVPEGSHRSTIDHPLTIVHVFRAASFDLGRVEIGDDGERFRITDTGADHRGHLPPPAPRRRQHGTPGPAPRPRPATPGAGQARRHRPRVAGLHVRSHGAPGAGSLNRPTRATRGGQAYSALRSPILGP